MREMRQCSSDYVLETGNSEQEQKDDDALYVMKRLSYTYVLNVRERKVGGKILEQ
jgi:hypothetical protein